jgi:predicted nucleotidyltransferase component of viral defense system
MVSSSPSRLTALQRELAEAFFRREQRMFLTGGAALAGYYLGHRTTEDLDLFGLPGTDLAEAARTLGEAAAECGATLAAQQTSPDFRRFLARRGDELCIVDLVVDRAPPIEAEKAVFGAVRVDTLREITANKVCTLLARSEIKDLVDLVALLKAGQSLEQALSDALQKDAGADPATLAWLLSEITITAEARLPGGVDPVSVDTDRQELVRRLRAIAFDRARK